MSRCVSEFIDESTNLFVDEFVADHSWINFSVYFDESGWRLKISVGGFFLCTDEFLLVWKWKKKYIPWALRCFTFFIWMRLIGKVELETSSLVPGLNFFMTDFLQELDQEAIVIGTRVTSMILRWQRCWLLMLGYFHGLTAASQLNVWVAKLLVSAARQALDKCRFGYNMISAMNFILLKKHLIKKLLSLCLIILQVMTKPIK